MNPVVLYTKKSTFVALRKIDSKLSKWIQFLVKLQSNNPQIYQKRIPTCALPKVLLTCDVFCN